MINIEDAQKRRKKFRNFYDSGNLPAAAAILDRLVNIQKRDSSNSKDFFVDLYNLATVNYEMGQFLVAKNQFTECVALIKPGASRHNHLDCLANLALCHAGLSEYVQAKERMDECIALCDLLGDERIGLDMRYNHAKILFLSGEYNAAADTFSLLIVSPGADEFFISDCYNCLGYTYEKMENNTAAETCFRKAMGIIKSSMGEYNEEYLSCVHYFAQYNALNKKFDAAIAYYKTASRIIRKLSSEGNAYFTDVTNRIADMYAMTGDIDKSLFYRLKSLRIMRSQLGEDHIYYANNLKNAALLYKEKNMTDKAVDFLLRSIKIKEKILGSSNIDYVRDVIQLCGLYIGRLDYGSAVEILQKAEDALKKQSGDLVELASEIGNVCSFLSDKAGSPSRKDAEGAMTRLKKIENKLITGGEVWFS